MNEVISHILKKPWVPPAFVGGVCLGVGLTAGYIYGRKKGVDDFLSAVNDNWLPDATDIEDIYDKIEDAREELQEFLEIEENTVETRQSFTEYREKLADLSYIPVEEEQPMNDELIDEGVFDEEDPQDETVEDVEEFIPVTITRNIFSPHVNEEGEIVEWDYDKEIYHREQNPNDPYVIHYDEFVRNDLGYRQETLTYYAGDDILADSINDTAIYKYPTLTGDLKFGYGSNDPNVVYIRNEGVRLEWEILRHQGSYAEEVHGLQVEAEYEAEDLKHSNNRKFRQEV